MVYAAVNFADPNVLPIAKFSTVAIITNIISPILITGGAILFLVMIFSGAFTLITAGDSPDKVTKAQHAITYAVLGLVIVLFSYLAVKLLGVVLNIQNELKPFGF